ncbi:MAG TPA: arsenite efflux transporter metallochaperone ArsD [Polyangiaceae bacterium]|nr:arsenite efflux transporter metallochaperone ArsD [Polyangiaceae bacterium]
MSIIVQVFDPAMCCSTGICGPSVDPQLIRFAADLEWLSTNGVTVQRFNLAQQPQAFVENALAKQALESEDASALPLVVVNGTAKSRGTYPTREQLAEWAGLAVPTSIFSDAVSELVALGASIASNCESCFKFHFDKARKLGVSREDMLRAVTVAQNVKDSPARAILALAEKYLRRDASDTPPDDAEPKGSSGGCCGSNASDSTSKKSKCCC